MHLDRVVADIYNYTAALITGNAAVKFIYGSFSVFAFSLFESNPLMIKAVIVLYFFDFVTGFLKARKLQVLSSRAFFRGCTKIVVYGIYLYIAIIVDAALTQLFGAENLNIITPVVFTAILVTDGLSIIENLEELGFKDRFGLLKLMKIFLNYNRRKVFDENIKKFGGDLLLNVEKDFRVMKEILIPTMPVANIRRMFELKIELLEDFVYKIATISAHDGHVFKMQYNTLLNQTGLNLEDRLRKTGFPKKEIEEFLERHGARVLQYQEEVVNLLKEVDGNTQINIQVQNNIVQATVRIIFNGIADNINQK